MTATLTTDDPENDKCPACGKSLSAVPPPPEEIADHALEIRRVIPLCKIATWEIAAEKLELAAAALERLAHGEELLKEALSKSYEHAAEFAQRAAKAEAERDEWKQAAEVEAGLRREFQDKAEKLQEKLDDNASQFEDRKFY